MIVDDFQCLKKSEINDINEQNIFAYQKNLYFTKIVVIILILSGKITKYKNKKRTYDIVNSTHSMLCLEFKIKSLKTSLYVYTFVDLGINNFNIPKNFSS